MQRCRLGEVGRVIRVIVKPKGHGEYGASANRKRNKSDDSKDLDLLDLLELLQSSWTLYRKVSAIPYNRSVGLQWYLLNVYIQ